MVAVDWVASPVGPLITAATAEAVCLLSFADPDKLVARIDALKARYADSLGTAKSAVLEALHSQLDEYFAGQRREFDLPLTFPGSDFQQCVWSTLLQIPYGQTWSYLDVAVRVADATATRAVGAANGANPIAIVIPCHRVINANGALGGYGGGLWRKEILLDLERGQGRLHF
jgi:AraC family transcriptional regulator, regulatory protein of adaptative response / methylated-DNA-[protein]-cysteine methyltransferase